MGWPRSARRSKRRSPLFERIGTRKLAQLLRCFLGRSVPGLSVFVRKIYLHNRFDRDRPGLASSTLIGELPLIMVYYWTRFDSTVSRVDNRPSSRKTTGTFGNNKVSQSCQVASKGDRAKEQAFHFPRTGTPNF